MGLIGKVALITGVASKTGIGYAVALRLGREGVKLSIADISKEVNDRGDELQSLGYEAASFKLNITKFNEVAQMVEAIDKKHGRLDILVNVAGIGPRGAIPGGFGKPLVELSEEDWDSQIAINLKTTFNCIRNTLPIMIKQRYGKIVNMSSVTGTMVSDPGASAYSAAKGGVSGLTKALALEVAEYGITVNAICPGWIGTGRELEYKAGLSSPMKRAGTAEEVANLVLFLASDQSSYLNGHNVVIDGGNILQEYKGEGELSY